MLSQFPVGSFVGQKLKNEYIFKSDVQSMHCIILGSHAKQPLRKQQTQQLIDILYLKLRTYIKLLSKLGQDPIFPITRIRKTGSNLKIRLKSVLENNNNYGPNYQFNKNVYNFYNFYSLLAIYQAGSGYGFSNGSVSGVIQGRIRLISTRVQKLGFI